MRPLILEYAKAQGWNIVEIVSEEEGILPIVLSGDINGFWRSATPHVPRSGMRAALFHPTTGYSLPEAVRLADGLGGFSALDSPTLFEWVRRRSLEAWRRNSYFRLLNRMLFRAAEPPMRYRVLERFYGLSEPLIRRFYSGHLTWSDKLRLVTGSPPVPIRRAIPCLLERRNIA
jgi:lycopene beta-cyclase